MVYILFFALLIIGALLVNRRALSRRYLFVIMLFLFVIIGFRDTTVGADTLGYTEDYMRIARMSFSEMWHYSFTTKEPMYVIISWLPSIFFTHYTAFLLTWALFPVVSLYKVFNEQLEDGKDIMIAILVFFLLGLFAFYVAGIRQTAALSMVFIGAKYLKNLSWDGWRRLLFNKSILVFLLTIVLAYMIHNSSILFVIAVPCLFFKIRWWYLLLVFGLLFLGNYVQIDQIVFLSKYFFADRFAAYGTVYESSQNMSAFIMQVILFLFCFAVKGKLVERDSQNNFYFNMMFLGLVFQSLSGMMAEMSRISFYFCMFAMLLVPRAFKEYSKKYWGLIYTGFICSCLYYLFFLTKSNLPEYQSIF